MPVVGPLADTALALSLLITSEIVIQVRAPSSSSSSSSSPFLALIVAPRWTSEGSHHHHTPVWLALNFSILSWKGEILTPCLTERCFTTLAMSYAVLWSSFTLDDNSYTKQQRHPHLTRQKQSHGTLCHDQLLTQSFISIVTTVMEKPWKHSFSHPASLLYSADTVGNNTNTSGCELPPITAKHCLQFVFPLEVAHPLWLVYLHLRWDNLRLSMLSFEVLARSEVSTYFSNFFTI